MNILLAEGGPKEFPDAADGGSSTSEPAELVIDAALIREYGGSGPRYTSYPTADRFVEAFDEAEYRRWLHDRHAGGFARELGLYVHLPFCGTICYYCGCNKIVAKDHGKSAKYVNYLGREARLLAECLGEDRAISQMHWGGGTPTFLADSELSELTRILRSEFEFAARGEYAVEVDPRTVNSERVALLAHLGFNRISIGVQDFDPEVQRAIHRIQSVEQTEEAVRAAREHRFRSVNVDLIYGLPKQTPEGFERTLALVDTLNPDRIALYSYAHLPALFKPQRRIAEADLPAPEIKLQLLTTAIDWFLSKGYVYIGMDHFAKPGDDLAVAQRQGRLTRNFQGYSGTGASDILGLGVSAISTVGPIYAQNAKTLDEYYGRLDSGALPVVRGLEPSADDLVRRAVIQALTCHFEVSTEAIAGAHLIDFEEYFSPELAELKQMEKESLVTVSRDRISVTPRGRLLVRAICAVFDRHLRAGRARASYSKVI